MTTQDLQVTPEPGYDVVVLAGGTGRRLGGASKPDVVARGRRLLDHVLDGLEHLRRPDQAGGPRRVVVVAPAQVSLPGGVLRALEDPPRGGPVAGVAAGVLALASQAAADGGQVAASTALLACDAPQSWRALPVLAARLEQDGRAGQVRDGVVAVEPEDGARLHVQHLVGVYRTRALRELVAPGGVGLRDVSVHRTFARLRLGQVDLSREPGLRLAAQDLDTWDEVRRWEETGR
ncbi:molybdenum cofactor guanylyltransferase [Actinomyces faecalis]|uniref:molybdenum cofactor guanylyltransferase n=1 Tax=Actinomyces faecalis TaxID=2722820 RepID=UPI001554BEE4|nr:NTP transferase domain-containing protein [Actinomyces faecalis]